MDIFEIGILVRKLLSQRVPLSLVVRMDFSDSSKVLR